MAPINFHFSKSAELQSLDEIDSELQVCGLDRLCDQRVLLATDFSKASRSAFCASLRVCQILKASLTILHVSEDAGARYIELGGVMEQPDTCDRRAHESLDRMMQEATQSGLNCRNVIGEGRADTTILEFLKSEKMSLVVLGTKPIHGFERLVFGSTAEAVIRKSKCPVLTVGPRASCLSNESTPVGGIVLFATDFHATTTEALLCAAFLGRAMNLPLHCLNVLPRSVEDASGNGVISLLIQEGLKHLASNLDPSLPVPICAVTHGSEISHSVVEYARQYDAKLIVLGVRRASLGTSHVPAHIAYRIITEAPCPVLTIAFPRDADGPRVRVPQPESCAGNAQPLLVV